MFQVMLYRAVPLAFIALMTSYALAFAEDPAAPTFTGPGDATATATTTTPAAAATPTATATATAGATAAATAAPLSTTAVASDGGHWTAYGFNITAPSSVWPMLEMLHAYKFDWELYGAQARPMPIVWANLPPGVYG